MRREPTVDVKSFAEHYAAYQELFRRKSQNPAIVIAGERRFGTGFRRLIGDCVQVRLGEWLPGE